MKKGTTRQPRVAAGTNHLLLPCGARSHCAECREARTVRRMVGHVAERIRGGGPERQACGDVRHVALVRRRVEHVGDVDRPLEFAPREENARESETFGATTVR